MASNRKYQVINGDVTIDFNRFCDTVANCQEEEIEKDFDKRSYQVSDSEVALNEIRFFIKDSIEQLKKGNKVIFTRANGDPPKVFEDLDSFVSWLNNFFSISRYQFIKTRVVDKVLSDE